MRISHGPLTLRIRLAGTKKRQANICKCHKSIKQNHLLQRILGGEYLLNYVRFVALCISEATKLFPPLRTHYHFIFSKTEDSSLCQLNWKLIFNYNTHCSQRYIKKTNICLMLVSINWYVYQTPF